MANNSSNSNNSDCCGNSNTNNCKKNQNVIIRIVIRNSSNGTSHIMPMVRFRGLCQKRSTFRSNKEMRSSGPQSIYRGYYDKLPLNIYSGTCDPVSSFIDAEILFAGIPTKLRPSAKPRQIRYPDFSPMNSYTE